MRNLKFTVAYDGSDYHGFQKQPKQPQVATIEGKLEQAMEELVGKKVEIIGASRTDARVHAKGQVFNCQLKTPIPTANFGVALNGLLPADIVIVEVTEASSQFHARYSNQGKRYYYQIYQAKLPSPFLRNYAYHITDPLDLTAMRQAAEHLIGEHDFTSFRAAGCNAYSPWRTLYNIDITVQNKLVVIDVAGDGFLYKMMRAIVGTLVQVGRGRLAASQLEEIIQAKDRSQAGPSAPGHGLFLAEIYY